MKIFSWNVNGIRAIAKKGLKKSVLELGAEVICFQETKAQDSETLEVLNEFEGYYCYTNSAVQKGYSGTAILTKIKPINVSYGIGIEEHDQEGRVITAEMDNFFIVTAYVPNSGRGLVRLEFRQSWDLSFLNYIKQLEKSKPVILCGDLNVAHQAKDLARPKNNYNKTAGYTEQEIGGFDNFLSNGFVDTFRNLYPEEISYSYWSYMFGARKKNIGWRIDYFLVSESILTNVKDAVIHTLTEGSDHCPIGIVLEEN